MRQPKRTDAFLRHVSAARAFHTGLLADTHRLRDALTVLAKHLDVIRQRRTGIAEKLDAADASCLQLKILETLGDSWRETYCDLRGSVHRVRLHLRRVARAKGPTR